MAKNYTIPGVGSFTDPESGLQATVPEAGNVTLFSDAASATPVDILTRRYRIKYTPATRYRQARILMRRVVTFLDEISPTPEAGEQVVLMMLTQNHYTGGTS